MSKLRFVLLMLIILAAAWTDQIIPRNTPTSLAPLRTELAAMMAQFESTPLDISATRIAELNELAVWTADELADHGTASLTFICTHNSRRSHLAQLWTSAAAAHFGIEGVQAFSGGTEATAFNVRTVAALRRAGFTLAEEVGGANPVYRVRWSDEGDGALCFSKRYTDPVNPAEGFAAVMTCSDADRGCPLVLGSAARFALPYLDPKASDGTPAEAATYDERTREIGREMHYLMGRVAERLASR